MLLAGQQKGNLDGKISHTTIPESLHLGTGLNYLGATLEQRAG